MAGNGAAEKFRIDQRIDETPKMKYLNRHVRDEVCGAGKWRDLGIELLDDTAALDAETRNMDEIKECCSRMFKLWIERQPGASWKQLIDALNKIKLNRVASDVEKSLIQPATTEKPNDESVKRRKLFKGHTLARLNGDYASVVAKIKNILKEKQVEVKDLLFNLNNLDADNSTVFSTDAASKITEIDDLFTEIGRYCNIFNYDLLLALLYSIQCKEAIKLLEGFTEKLQQSILMELDLLSEIEEPQSSMPGTHRLIIKYTGGSCTAKIEKLIRSVICECFHLETWSISFNHVEMGCVAFVYQILSAVKSHLLHYKTTIDDSMLMKHDIKCIMIDDEEVWKMPSTPVKTIVESEAISDTSESGPSDEGDIDKDTDDDSISKSYVEKVYSELEGLTFKGTFNSYEEMGVHQSTKRPTYRVTDDAANEVLSRIYHKLKRRSIWKGITTSDQEHEYILYGTQNSVGHKEDGIYHIPLGGVHVIVTPLTYYEAMVNITVE